MRHDQVGRVDDCALFQLTFKPHSGFVAFDDLLAACSLLGSDHAVQAVNDVVLEEHLILVLVTPVLLMGLLVDSASAMDVIAVDASDRGVVPQELLDRVQLRVQARVRVLSCGDQELSLSQELADLPLRSLMEVLFPVGHRLPHVSKLLSDEQALHRLRSLRQAADVLEPGGHVQLVGKDPHQLRLRDLRGA